MSYLKLIAAFAGARRNKRRPSFPAISSSAIVNTDLQPRGSVLVNGELWNAETSDRSIIRSRERVTVIGFREHLLVVKAQN